MTKEQVLENLKTLIGEEYETDRIPDMGDDIICAFGDFTEGGETEVIVGDNICYINTKNATEFGFEVEKIFNDDGYKVAEKFVDFWIC